MSFELTTAPSPRLMAHSPIKSKPMNTLSWIYPVGVVVMLQLCCVTRVNVERRSYITSKHEKPIGTVRIVIDKSDYELRVYDEHGWFATYPVVFGNKSLDDKKMQGDRNTPEGTFRIL